jgi:chromosome partitioning protein
MKIVSIINNKGGVGKTTLVQNLSVGLARKGYKVGLIDFDPQANLSSVFGHEPKETLREILSEGKKITTKSFSATYQDNLFIIPNLKDISVKMFGFLNFQDEKTILKDKLGKIDFDFLFIDTPPNLELQTINSMIASDFILIPVKYDIFSLQGIVTVKEYFDKTKEKVNKNLDILGIVATSVDERESINSPIRAKLEAIFDDKVLTSTIKVNTKFKHAQIQRQDVYAMGDLKAVADFESLIAEILPKLTK